MIDIPTDFVLGAGMGASRIASRFLRLRRASTGRFIGDGSTLAFSWFVGDDGPGDW